MSFLIGIWIASMSIGFGALAVDKSHQAAVAYETHRIENVVACEEAPVVVPEEMRIAWLTERTKADLKAWNEANGVRP